MSVGYETAGPERQLPKGPLRIFNTVIAQLYKQHHTADGSGRRQVGTAVCVYPEWDGIPTALLGGEGLERKYDQAEEKKKSSGVLHCSPAVDAQNIRHCSLLPAATIVLGLWYTKVINRSTIFHSPKGRNFSAQDSRLMTNSLF